MTQITVTRSANFLGMARAYKVIVDGREIGRVKNNATEMFTIDNGSHEMKVGISAMNGMSNVVKFEASEGDDLAFTTTMNPLLIVGLLFSLFGGGLAGYGFAQEVTSQLFLGMGILFAGVIIASIYSIKLKQTV